MGGDSGYLSHTHSRSDSLATVSTIALFDTQEVEQDLEDDIGLIMKPASRKDLVNRFDELEEGEEHEDDGEEMGVACQDGRSLSVVSHVARQPVRVFKSSLRGYGMLTESNNISIINHTLQSTVRAVINTLTCTSMASNSTSDSKCYLAVQVHVRVLLLPLLYED